MTSWIYEQTPAVCLAAVKKSGLALKHIKHQTPEICLTAVRQNGRAIRFVEEPTIELYCEAVKQNPKALKYIPYPTHEVYRAAIDSNPCIILTIENPSDDLITQAVSKYPGILRDLIVSEELALRLVQQVPGAIRWLRKPSKRVRLAAVETDAMQLKYIDKQTPEIICKAIQRDPAAYVFVKWPYTASDFAVEFLRVSPEIIFFVDWPSVDMYRMALQDTTTRERLQALYEQGLVFNEREYLEALEKNDLPQIGS